MVDTRNVARTGNDLVDSISFIFAWDAPVLKYGFKQSDIDNNGINDFDEGNWKVFYEAIFDNISSFTNQKFVETRYDDALLTQILEEGGGGQSSNAAPDVVKTETVVRITGGVAAATAVVFQGQYSEVWYHEIGHSLGLRHSFEIPNLIDDNVKSDVDFGEHFLNSALYTVMSYSPFVWGEDNPWTDTVDIGQTYLRASVGSFMPIDIAALQNMYGASEANTGNTTYAFGDDLATNMGYRTIWDTGGTDTIVYDGDSRAKIDLRAATLQKEIGGGGFLSTSETLTGGFLIAHGVVVENATGAGQADFLIGNARANVLTGLGGADVLQGLAGNDVLIGGEGDDVLIGGAGHDRLTGGAGSDLFLFARGAGRDSIADFGTDDVLVTLSAIRDVDGSGIIDFGANHRLDLTGGSIGIADDTGAAVRALEYDGSYEKDGTIYYVYSRVGSAAGIGTAAAHDFILA